MTPPRNRSRISQCCPSLRRYQGLVERKSGDHVCVYRFTRTGFLYFVESRQTLHRFGFRRETLPLTCSDTSFNAHLMKMELLDYNIFDLDDFGDLASSFSDFIDDDFNFDEVEESSSDQSTESSQMGSTKSQSKRPRIESIRQLQRNYKLSRPRIIKSDFRRKFPQILASVFNSADYDFLRCHINTFYDNGVSIVQQDLRTGTVAF